MRDVTLPTAEDLAAARAVVAEHLAPTPILQSRDAALKLETAQPTGAFKVRGALAALNRLAAGTPVVTASTGNHALGIAWASQRLGVTATVVVPETTSPAKLDKLRALGADLVLHGTEYDDAEQHALAHGAHFVSPCNDTGVIAGQSTVGSEIGEQLGDGPLCVVVPVGGGGLISGTLLWAQSRGGVRVVGVQAEASPTMIAAVAAGDAVDVPTRDTIADGVTGSLEPGALTIRLAAQADALLEVSEPEIHDALRFLASEHGLIAEGAGAVPIAAIRSGKVAAQPGERLVAVVTGRNIALAQLAAVLAAG